MGMYINPSNETKESWLSKNAEHYGQQYRRADTSSDYKTIFPVCLVDNGPFTAAAICFRQEEFECFSQPDDYRPKNWYVCNVDNLKSIDSGFKEYMEDLK
jgi:hypothetical protein